MHLGTKTRNRILSLKAFLLMGNQIVSMNRFKEFLSSSANKLFHCSVYLNLNPCDHENVASCWQISRDEIIETLETVDNANATLVYIKLLRCIIDASIEKSTSLLD